MAAPVPLSEILRLEPIEVNLFRGFTPQNFFSAHRIFGGQVIAQALLAAYRTITDRPCHSLHAYFIRQGDPQAPVLYEVERARDGRSFATRRVIAIQHGEQILNLAASFHAPEEGFSHQTTMPAVAGPEGLREARDLIVDMLAKKSPEKAREIPVSPIELRPLDPSVYVPTGPRAPTQQLWFRAREDFGGDIAMNHAALAYASDIALLSTAMLPHDLHWSRGDGVVASLDHVLWFHRQTNASAWHLYDMESPTAYAARGFNRGAIYTMDGVLVASVCQEGVMRRRREKP